MDNIYKNPSYRLFVLITTPKLADKAALMFKKGALPLQYRFNAEGTASSEMMDMLGLGSVDKSVLVSMMPKKLSDILHEKLHSELKLDTANSGIAFTIPMNGVNNLIIRMMEHNSAIQDANSKEAEEHIMTGNKYTLICAIVKQGYSGDVMDSVRDAGAGGGTVIRSHRIGNEEITGFWGLSAREEKEIVLILTESEKKLDLMKTIGEKCGMHSDAKGIVMSLPVDSVSGM